MWSDVKMWEDVRRWRWEDVRRCEDEKMWRWEDVRRCEDEKMWEDVKMRRCEKMIRCEDRHRLLEEPFAQTLWGKNPVFKNTPQWWVLAPGAWWCSAAAAPRTRQRTCDTLNLRSVLLPTARVLVQLGYLVRPWDLEPPQVRDKI